MHSQFLYRWAVRLVLVSALLLAGVPAVSAVEPERPVENDGTLKATFIRGGDLWIKAGGQERQLTTGEKARKPLWSADGQWIAYAAGENTIRLIHPASNHNVEIGAGTNYQWSPKANMLAFLDGELLQVTDAAKASSEKFQNASIGVGNYSWLPDGGGFLVSTLARPQPDGWSDISLYEVPFAYGQNPQRPKLIVSFPSQSKSFFAVTTGNFEWSADRKWVRFIAKPTASLSADSNTLCVLFWSGHKILPVGEMLNRDSWAAWSPEGNMLAFIGGIGRDATRDKKLIVKRPPFRKQTTYTPPGFADRDPAWENSGSIVVSRAKELPAESGGQSAVRPAPFLARVSVQDGTSAALTSPPESFGDYSPAYMPASRQWTWVRTDGRAGAVWTSAPDGKDAREWIGAVDMAPDYYGQLYWSEVLDRYGSRR